jgi:hypothetical protein
LNKSAQKQSSELFLAMTEALSKTYTYSRTLVLRNARTNPCFSFPVFMAEKWDFSALHLCHIGTNPGTARLTLGFMSKLTASLLRHFVPTNP